MKNAFAALFALLLTACGGVPVTKDDANRAQFAAKPSDEEAIHKVRGYLENVMIDPDSLKLRCSKVRKGWGRQNMYDKPIFGWVVLCGVNGKNKFGGYTGEKSHLFIMNGTFFTAIDSEHVADGSGTHSGFLD
jgi:hypothetical protein